MNIEELKNTLLDSAKDIKLNLSSVMSEAGSADLNQQQIFIIALASAYATKNAAIIQVVLKETIPHLDENEVKGAQSAATIMAMNNIYYRFIHLVNDSSFSTMPAKLRMNVIANPGMNKINFELCCLVASAINGCGMCMEAHSQVLIKAGISKVAIQSAIRIAAVLNAAAMGVLIGEAIV